MKINTLKIMIIDNDFSLHEVYESYHKTYVEYTLGGIYISTKDALQEYDIVQPDIIFIELSLPDSNGIEAIRSFQKRDSNVKIIMMSKESDFDTIKTAFKNGANGYVTKPMDCKKFYRSLNSIKYEGAAMSRDIVKKVISNFHRKTYQFFSERENQIIDYLCNGATYKMIAEKLFVTTSTINFHVQNIYLKLNVNSKSEALLKLKELR